MPNLATQFAEPHGPEPSPQIRYSMRTLLWVTTGVAILAALLAPLLRGLTEESLRMLLIVWSTALVSFAMHYYVETRWARKRIAHVKEKLGDDFRFLLPVMPTAYVDAMQRPRRLLLRLTGVVAICLVYAVFPFLSENMVTGTEGPLTLALMNGYVVGVMSLGYVIARPSSAVFLRQQCVNLDLREIPWSYIRDAHWLSKRPNILRMHRLDGDLLVSVPEETRDEVEAFVTDRVTSAGRTAFGRT